MTVVASTGLLATLEACSSSSSSAPAPIEAGTTSGSSGTSSGTSGASSGTSGASSGTSGASSGTSGTSGSSGDAGFDAADARDANDGAPACLNDVGAAPACPGPGGAGCATQCATIVANFKKGVAAEAVKNLTAPICAGNTANAVTTSALTKSCVDPSAQAFCTDLQTGGCNAGNGFAGFLVQCVATANGLSGIGTGPAGAPTPATLGRKALYDCINNAGNGHDCTTCLDLVKGGP